MDKKRVDIELELDILSFYAAEATKKDMSRRKFMALVLERVCDVMQQSPHTPLSALFAFKSREDIKKLNDIGE